METLTRRPRPVQNSMKKKIDWEVVGVVLFIFTLFPFVWFYRELIQQTSSAKPNDECVIAGRKISRGHARDAFTVPLEISTFVMQRCLESKRTTRTTS